MRKNLFIIVLIFTILISTSNSEIKNVHADGATTLPPFTTLDSCSIEGTYGIVYTPNNTAVDVFNYYDILELLPGDKAYARNYAESVFPNLVFLAEATKNYNCHSYAWYSQSVNTNEYCMGNPSAYYTDGSYVEVTSPQVGDRICYFFDNNTTALYDDENIHSGIVIAVHDGASNGVCGIANLVTVRSKWGFFPLYEHRGDECPYVETSKTLQSFPIKNNKYADYIKFYRRHAGHSYTDHYESIDINTHKAYCFCGEYITESHDYIVQQHNLSYHKKSCYCNKVIQEEHSFLNGQCVICNQCDHEYGYSYVNDTTCRATCYNCMFTTTQAHVFMIGNLDYCINCKATIDSGFGAIIHQGIINLVSLNGSYVLPNGNIVLVPEDLQAYYNGTLVFYNKNELPEVA